MTAKEGASNFKLTNRLKKVEERDKHRNFLISARLLLGINQQDMSELIEVSQSTYCNMEYGRTDCPEWKIKLVRERFEEWKTEEIARLKQKIEELESLTELKSMQ